MEVDPNNIDLHQEKSSLVHVTNLDTRFEKKSLQVIIRRIKKNNNDVIMKMKVLKKPFYQVSSYHKFLTL